MRPAQQNGPVALAGASTGPRTDARHDSQGFESQNQGRAALPLRQAMLPFAAGSATSRQAAVAARDGAGTIRARVLAYFVGRGATGATDEEAQLALRLKPQTETPRRGELVKLLTLRDSGRRRRTSSGRWATVWAATAAGVPYA